MEMRKFNRLGFGLLVICLSQSIAQARLAQIGSDATPFALKNLDGERVLLEEYLDRKTVLLAFVSETCRSCHESFPVLNRMASTYQASDQLKVVCIVLDDDNQVTRLIDSEAIDTRIQFLLDEFGDGAYATAEAYGVLGVPIFFLIGRDGKVAWKHIGALRAGAVEREIENEIERALGE
jgi:cytochrome c biogenesis protein CcmG/thiol:disulfide interchange protein DsbE